MVQPFFQRVRMALALNKFDQGAQQIEGLAINGNAQFQIEPVLTTPLTQFSIPVICLDQVVTESRIEGNLPSLLA